MREASQASFAFRLDGDLDGSQRRIHLARLAAGPTPSVRGRHATERPPARPVSAERSHCIDSRAMPPPEPDLTPREMIARAVALRPKLVEQQAECEERTYLLAGAARGVRRSRLLPALRPAALRRLRVRRADVHAAWCSRSRAAARRPRGAWASPPRMRCRWRRGGRSRRRRRSSATATSAPRPWPRRSGRRRSSTTAGSSTAARRTRRASPTRPTTWARRSSPSSTSAACRRCCSSSRRRSEWTMLDDWGHLLGLKGSGSHTIVFEGGRIPAALGARGQADGRLRPERGHPGAPPARQPDVRAAARSRASRSRSPR